MKFDTNLSDRQLRLTVQHYEDFKRDNPDSEKTFEEFKHEFLINRHEKNKAFAKEMLDKHGHHSDYKKYLMMCDSDGILPMPYNQWKRNKNTFKKNDIDVSRWNNAKTPHTFHEKMDKDNLFSSIVSSRTSTENGVSMSNRIGVDKYGRKYREENK